MKKRWYNFAAPANGVAALTLDGEVGEGGVSAQAFIADLNAVDAPEISVSINSPGGDLFQGLAIYNALRRHPAQVMARIDGFAASAASLIAMAADRIIMPASSMMMVHGVSMYGVGGTAEEVRGAADAMDRMNENLTQIYVARTGQAEEQIRAMLNTDTWLDAQEALSLGFADEIEDVAQMVAKFDLERLPERYRDRFVTLNTRIVAALEAADLNTWKEHFLARGFADFEQAEAAIRNAVEVRNLVDVAGIERERAKANPAAGGDIGAFYVANDISLDAFITSGKSIAEVRSIICRLRAKQVDDIAPNPFPKISNGQGIKGATHKVYVARAAKRIC